MQLPKHQLIRTLVHNYETLGNNMGTNYYGQYATSSDCGDSGPAVAYCGTRPLVDSSWPVGAYRLDLARIDR